MKPGNSKFTRFAGTIYVILYMAFLLAPIAIMVPASFTAQEILMFPPDHFSLRWYEDVIRGREWLAAARISLGIGAAAMVLSTIAGLLVGFCVFHYGPLSTGIRLLLVSPMLVPHIVVATGLFEILVPLKLLGSKTVLAIGHASVALPITVILSITAFEAIDRNLWTAAATLGARVRQIVTKVIMPLTATGSIACLILSFESSWHEVTLAVFVGPAVEPTLPNKMFSILLQESSPALAAVSTLLVAITLLCTGALGLLAIRRKGKPEATA